MSAQALVTGHMVGTVKTEIWLAHQEPTMGDKPSSDNQETITTHKIPTEHTSTFKIKLHLLSNWKSHIFAEC
jgi:hypothetical protein